MADQRGLPWDVACSTGAIATSRPFVGSKWECGSFNVNIARTISKVNFRFEEARCTHESDRALLLEKVEMRSEEGVAGFNTAMTVRITVRMLSPIMRHAAYMDDGDESLRILRDAVNLLEDY